ncbi:MAG: LysR family transcriptional regulator [Casimicrobiaceae bacterium]
MPRLVTSLLHPRQLEAIVAVARVGSVHAAARELRIPQPALSRLVAASERMLGIRLFARSRSGTLTTPAGDRVIKEAAFALHALESVSEAAREPLPVVRLGCIPRVMHVLIPHLLAQMSDSDAGFRLQVSVGTSIELASELEAARLDFVIARRAAPGMVDAMELDAEKLYTERTVVVCGRDNLAVGGTTCHVRQLARLPWLLPKRGFYSRDLMDKIVAGAGLAPIVPVIESNSFESSLSVVAATRFLAIAPEFAAHRFEQLELVRIVRMTPSLGASPVMLQYPPRQRAHPGFEPFRAAAMRAARGARG